MLLMIGQNHESFDEEKETGVNLVLGSFNVILLAQGLDSMVEDHFTIVFYPHTKKGYLSAVADLIVLQNRRIC